jgi:predicted nucleic acid-binding protein
MLMDSDILIWLTRGHAGARAVLDKIKPWRISSVTYIELAQGCRNQQELKQVKQGLLAADTEIIPITANISSLAMSLIDEYALASGLRLADALIAATALEGNLTLLTANTKHFKHIKHLKVKGFDPEA